jgi:hypothetical protein
MSAGRTGTKSLGRQSCPWGWNYFREIAKDHWMDEQIARLAAIVAAGGSPARAAAKSNRSINVCRTQARAMGAPFAPLYIRRRILLAKYAAAENALVR